METIEFREETKKVIERLLEAFYATGEPIITNSKGEPVYIVREKDNDGKWHYILTEDKE